LRGLHLFKAEGTGLEPATPCGAPHFQDEFGRSAAVRTCPKLYLLLHLRSTVVRQFSPLSAELAEKWRKKIGRELSLNSGLIDWLMEVDQGSL